jgi:hypothetical protein
MLLHLNLNLYCHTFYVDTFIYSLPDNETMVSKLDEG